MEILDAIILKKQMLVDEALVKCSITNLTDYTRRPNYRNCEIV
jgi:hypothetical protein